MADAKSDFRKEKLEAKKAERREAARKFKSEPLKITSLMDALTIILIFLLKSYGSDPMQVPQKKNELMLPKSSSISNMAECVDIQVSRSAIVVKGKQVVKLNKGAAVANAEKVYSPSDNKLIVPLKNALDEWRKKGAEQRNKDPKRYEGEAFIAADSQIPFKIIKQVLYTATKAKYTKFTFAIVKTRGG